MISKNWGRVISILVGVVGVLTAFALGFDLTQWQFYVTYWVIFMAYLVGIAEGFLSRLGESDE